METSDLAMVSRIRVEVRGGSMEAAEKVAFLALAHAQMAGVLEGIVPESGAYTDHFFNYPQMTGKPSDPPDPWSELGLRYAGRLTFAFEPMVARGGLKLYGYKVVRDDRQGPEDRWPSDNGEDVTDKVIVLSRANEVTREHVWEGTPSYEEAVALEEAAQPKASAEDILDNIRRLVNVDHVEVQSPHNGMGWIVMVDLRNKPDSIRAQADTLREAALDAYGKCGVEVTHFDTERVEV